MDPTSYKSNTRLVVCHVRRGLRTPTFGMGCVWLVAVAGVLGCAGWGRRPSVPGAIAECRQLSRLGHEAIEQGEWVRGEDLLRKAIAANPADSEAPRQLAEVLWRQGERSAAIRQMETAF